MNRVTATDHCICNNVAAEEPNRSFLWDTDSGNPWPKHFRNEQVNSSREIKWPNTQTALDWDQRQIPIKSVWYDVFSQHNWAECLKCWVFAVPRSTSCSANRSLNLQAPVQTNLSRPWLTLEQFVAVNSGQTPRLPEHHTGCFNSIQWLPFTCQLSVSVTTGAQQKAAVQTAARLKGGDRRKPLETTEVYPRRGEVGVLRVRVYGLLWETPDRLIWNPEVKKKHLFRACLCEWVIFNRFHHSRVSAESGIQGRLLWMWSSTQQEHCYFGLGQTKNLKSDTQFKGFGKSVAWSFTTKMFEGGSEFIFRAGWLNVRSENVSKWRRLLLDWNHQKQKKELTSNPFSQLQFLISKLIRCCKDAECFKNITIVPVKKNLTGTWEGLILEHNWRCVYQYHNAKKPTVA